MAGTSPARCAIESRDATSGARLTTPTEAPWTARRALRMSRRTEGLFDTTIAVDPRRSDRSLARVSPTGATGYSATSAVGTRSRGWSSTGLPAKVSPASAVVAEFRPTSAQSSRANSGSPQWNARDSISKGPGDGRDAKLPDPSSQRIRPRQARSAYTAATVFLWTPEAAATARMLGSRFPTEDGSR